MSSMVMQIPIAHQALLPRKPIAQSVIPEVGESRHLPGRSPWAFRASAILVVGGAREAQVRPWVTRRQQPNFLVAWARRSVVRSLLPEERPRSTLSNVFQGFQLPRRLSVRRGSVGLLEKVKYTWAARTSPPWRMSTGRVSEWP